MFLMVKLPYILQLVIVKINAKLVFPRIAIQSIIMRINHEFWQKGPINSILGVRQFATIKKQMPCNTTQTKYQVTALKRVSIMKLSVILFA